MVSELEERAKWMKRRADFLEYMADLLDARGVRTAKELSEEDLRDLTRRMLDAEG